MAIARKPQSHQSEVETFIARGSSSPAGKDDKDLPRFPLSARALKARRRSC
jgi:hypothetical protein